MLNATFYAWTCTFTVLILLKAKAELVNITYVESAVATGAGEILLGFRLFCVQFTYVIIYESQQLGLIYYSPLHIVAVCLDGSPPAYHLSRGSASGVNSWLVQIEVYPNTQVIVSNKQTNKQKTQIQVNIYQTTSQKYAYLNQKIHWSC